MRTTNIISISRLVVVFSVLMVGTVKPVSAELIAGENFGAIHSTANASQQQSKCLGEQNVPNGCNSPWGQLYWSQENYNREAQRQCNLGDPWYYFGDSADGRLYTGLLAKIQAMYRVEDDPAAAVPEPATILIFGLGITGAAAARRRSGRR